MLHPGDITDSLNTTRLISEIKPDETYNLGVQSHVTVSLELPEYTANTDALGTLRILEAVRVAVLTTTTKVYQASTAELYGLVQETPQKETTPLEPRSPYGIAKPYAFWMTKHYRETTPKLLWDVRCKRYKYKFTELIPVIFSLCARCEI